MSTAVHPVLRLINRCDTLAQTFDTHFSASCTLLSNLAAGTPAAGSPTTMDDTLMSLRSTLASCEEVVGQMLACIYEDIPHLLDQLDREGAGQGGPGVVGNWNPRLALDGISQLFYSYQDLLTEKRELLADFTCEEIGPKEFVDGWTSVGGDLKEQRKQQVDDLADLLAAF
ncbi:hypothetical protein PSEUBRA_001928 [Kalmanozyma brasiliensis GHG001]|uniref:Uncharacterized protein n=1 Tax=Kalmanozyma brasiliensis (strain GHG001) TaxID=1365824 RepID=V5EZY3_KALBG|nr:uncharacterized protein PSEUBRA_001928 [Kalmanozyma brasiliensis GHG001]EST08504.1 hypothetical protein PSEUBRA_001928 [Kalmanozyma brasiliensis GHG001]